jgi:hypothetical protein
VSLTSPSTPLETVTRTAPFGVLFWDPVTGRPVVDGLVLSEIRSGIQAWPSASGVFAFHNLPGLTASAFGSGDPAFWASPPGQATDRFQLLDAAGAFIPFTFDAAVPHPGLFTAAFELAGSPPDQVVGAIPLFSSPSRLVPAGTAVVRANLWDATGNRPAARAVLHVTTAPPRGGSYRGIADSAGRVAVLFPYPEPGTVAASPPRGRSLAQQTWPLSVSVSYSGGADPPADLPPDISTVLEQPAVALRPAPGASSAVIEVTLSFGIDLVLRTTGQSVLHLLPT